MLHISLSTLPLLIAFIFDACMALLVLSTDRKKAINQSYAVFIWSISAWQLMNLIHIWIQSTSLNLLASRATFFSGLLIVLSLIYFVTVLHSQSHNKKLLRAFFVSTIVGSIFIFSSGIIAGTTTVSGFYSVGEFFPLYFVFIILGILIALTILLYPYKQLYTRHKIQVRWLILGLTIPSVIGVYTHLYLPLLQWQNDGIFAHPSGLSNLGPASTMILSIIVAYSILRHRLLGVKWLIRRELISHSLNTLATIGIVLPVLFFLPIAFSYRLLIVSFVVFPLFFVLQPLARRLTEKLTKKQIIDLYKLGPEEKYILSKCQKPEDLARMLYTQLLKRIPIEGMTVVAYDPISIFYRHIYPRENKQHYSVSTKWIQYLEQHTSIAEHDVDVLAEPLHTLNSGLAMPLHDGNRLLGIMFLGRRIDQKKYSADDHIFLENFQKDATRALWSVLQLEHAAVSRIDDPYTVQHTLTIIKKTASG